MPDLDLTPTDVRAIARAGCELAQSGNLADALGLLQGLAALAPDDAPVRAALGTVLHKLGRLDDARRAYLAALERDPQQPVALGNLGELELAVGSPDAPRWLRRAAALPAHPPIGAVERARALLLLLEP